MVRIGSPAPDFECTAVVGGRAVPANRRQLHPDDLLVLVFDSLTFASNLLSELATRTDARAEFDRLRAALVVVCRDPLYDVLTANVPFPLIADADNDVAGLYGMLRPDGTPLWGYCVIDADGFIRRLVQCDVPASSSVAELLQYLASVADSDPLKMPC